MIEEFLKVLNVAKALKANLRKEPQVRRDNFDRVNKFLVELDSLEDAFNKLKIKFNKSLTSKEDTKIAKEYAQAIIEILQSCREIILTRLENIDKDRIEIIDSKTSDSDSSTKSLAMGEKFDLRTAASLLPNMDGTEDVTKQLIDGIELYNEMLDDNGKAMLIKYVLKTKLSQNAKLRLDSAYNTVEDLLVDIKTHLLTKKSATALATQLVNANQNQKSISEFGSTIERLMLDLTLSQASDNNSVKILRSVNEKLAINSFSNGLRNDELKTIIKARNYTNLKDAIAGALDEEVTNSASPSSANLFHMRGRYNKSYLPNRNRGRFHNHNNANRNSQHYANSQRYGNYSINNNFGRPTYSNLVNFKNNQRQSRGNLSLNRQTNNDRVNYNSSQGQGRTYYSNNNNAANGRMYCAEIAESALPDEVNQDTFFRV